MSRLNFTHSIPSAQLQLRVKKLLIDLMMLGEAKAASMVRRDAVPTFPGRTANAKRHAESMMPADPDSLYELYLAKFTQAAPDPGEVEAVCLEAEEELKSAKGGERWRLEEDDRRTAQAGRSEEKDIETLVDHLQGEHKSILAIRHKWPIGWIEHQRIKASQDPVYGVPRENFRAMNAEERAKAVAKLYNTGTTQKEAADRLGVSQRTVAEYWPGGRARAA